MGQILEWSPEAAKSWAGYIGLYGVWGSAARRREERRWYGKMAEGNPAALEHLLARHAYRENLAAWHAECAHRSRQALLLRLRANEGADATTGRNYRIWRRWSEGGVTYAQLGREFGMSGHRAGDIVARQRAIAPLRQKIWLEGRRNLGRPIDLDAGRKDYRGIWWGQWGDDQRTDSITQKISRGLFW
jgi:hypothetical protein